MEHSATAPGWMRLESYHIPLGFSSSVPSPGPQKFQESINDEADIRNISSHLYHYALI